MTSRSGKIDPPTFRQNLQQYFNREGTYPQDSNPSVRILSLRPWPSPTRVLPRLAPAAVAGCRHGRARRQRAGGTGRRRRTPARALRHPERCPNRPLGRRRDQGGGGVGRGDWMGRDWRPLQDPPGRQVGCGSRREREGGGKNSDAEE